MSRNKSGKQQETPVCLHIEQLTSFHDFSPLRKADFSDLRWYLSIFARFAWEGSATLG